MVFLSMQRLSTFFCYLSVFLYGHLYAADVIKNIPMTPQASQSCRKPGVWRKSSIKSTNCIPCKRNKANFFERPYHRLRQVWFEGQTELYLPIYAWHNRYVYSPERIRSYNENPWGGGLGKGFYDKEGDWHGLYAFAFLDSHKNIEPIVGYAFLKAWHPHPDITLGGGYALLATIRPDINHGNPFPGLLPWVYTSYRRVSLITTYIPGHNNVGNVLFLITKVTL